MKRLSMSILGAVLLAALAWLLWPKPKEVSKPVDYTLLVEDYPHHAGRDALLWPADSLRYGLDFEHAYSVYEALLAGALQPAQRAHALNQLAGMSLALDRDSAAQHWIAAFETDFPNPAVLPAGARADYTYNKGLFAYHRFQPDSAFAGLRRALDLYKKVYPGQQHLRVAQCLNTLGLLHYEHGGVVNDSAFLYIYTASNMFQSHELKTYSWESDYGMACLCITRRSYEESEMYCEKAIKSIHQIQPQNPLFMARCWSMKGNAIKKQGNYVKADTCFKISIDLAESTGSIRIQEFYQDLIINDTRFSDDSLRFFKHLNMLKEILNDTMDYFGSIDRLMGYYYYRKFDWNKCINYYTGFVKKINKTKNINQKLLDEALFAISNSYMELSDYDNALKYSLLNISVGKTYPNVPSWDRLNTYEFHKNNTYTLIGYGIVANILMKRYVKHHKQLDLVRSDKLFMLFDSLFFPSIISKNENESAILEFQSKVGEKTFMQALEATCFFFNNTKNISFADKGFRYCERMKSYILYRDILLGNRSDLKWLDSLRFIKSTINQLEFYKMQIGNLSETQASELEFSYLKLQRYIKAQQRNVELFQESTMQKIPKISEIRSMLADNQSIVQYAQGNEKMFLLYIDKNNIVFDSVPSFYSTKKEAEKYLGILNRRDHKEKIEYIQAASYLYERLIKPFEKYLLDNQNLLIVPAGYLNLIPFDPLLQNYDAKKSVNTSFKNLPYLFNRVQIEYSPSWKVWQANSKPEQNRQSFRSAAVWLDTSLPNWQSDKDSLSEIFNNANVACDFFTGKECSKQHFLRNHKKYDILHLSMHAKTSLMQRRDNKIFFSDRKGDTLYGFDIQRQVYKANFVMLSACETAVGSTEPGEGSYSLTRAFLAGGIPNVISTMWQVDYQPTSQLVFNFYREFLREKSVSKALRSSKISYIKQSEEYWAHPGFWAGLINIQ